MGLRDAELDVTWGAESYAMLYAIVIYRKS